MTPFHGWSRPLWGFKGGWAIRLQQYISAQSAHFFTFVLFVLASVRYAAELAHFRRGHMLHRLPPGTALRGKKGHDLVFS